jgi:ribosomal protein S27AE
MKKTQTCPKCSSKDIFLIPGFVGLHGVGNNIPLGLMTTPVKVARFVCGTCGFSEEWILDKEDILKLKSKYKR